MGKTENGAIWLNYEEGKKEFSTHPRDFWNYWRDKTENDLVGRWMRLFTDLSLNEIREYESLEGEDVEKAKELLATKITETVHGKDSDWNSNEVYNISKDLINNGIGLLSFLSPEFLNLTKSNSESRRFVKSQAIKINGTTISDEKYTLNLSDFNQEKGMEISLGKKKKIIVRIEK